MRKKEPNALQHQTKPNYREPISKIQASNQEPPPRRYKRDVWESPQNRPDLDKKKSVYVHPHPRWNTNVSQQPGGRRLVF